MSIFSSLQSAITGLSSQSSALAAISDNIVNVSTTGYKTTTTEFSSLVTNSKGSYTSGGVSSVASQQVSKQGLLSTVDSSTSMGVSGNGFFVVSTDSTDGSWAYTRAGDFSLDSDGYLKNTSSYYLQGWSLLPYDGSANASTVNIDGITYMKAYYDSTGSLVYINDNSVDSTNLNSINLTSVGGTASATTQISYGANLPSGDSIYNSSDSTGGGRYSVSSLIYDSLGNANNISLIYTKTSTNGWGMSSSIPSGAASVTLTGDSWVGNASDDVYGAIGQLEFTSVPENGSQVTVNGDVYYFTTDTTSLPAGVDKENVVDLTGMLSTSDFVEAFSDVLQDTQPSGDRFQADGERVLITQSTFGDVITVDASKTTGCVQSAANVDSTTGISSGYFTIAAVSENLTNGAAIEFSQQPTAGESFVLDGVTYTFVDSTTKNSNDVLIGKTLAETLTNLQTSLNTSADEPSRFVVSGTTLEIYPSASGGDISFDFSSSISNVSGKYRSDGGLWNVTGSGMLTVGDTFEANGLQSALTEGSMVSAVSFDTDGTPLNFYVDSMNITWANGAKNMGDGVDPGNSITLFSGNAGTSSGLTSLSGSFTTSYVKQDGASFGAFTDVYVSSAGVVTALFDNGETLPIALIPLASFANDEGLQGVNGNSWVSTSDSGDPILSMASTNGTGTIESYALEASTVDIATEFSNMIVVQRAYSASTQIITTADEMLQELSNMV